MSSVHVVAVWEWQCGPRWLPHSPGVSRTLERAHGKRLTRVVLADAEPALRGHSVNLRSLTQAADEGGGETRVRRRLFPLASPGARGRAWEWAADDDGYDPLPMEIQCQLEDAWARGSESVVFDEWVVSLKSFTARAPNGALRLLRRRAQPPYPLAKNTPPAPPPPARPALPPAPHTVHRSRIPQQHTGSSVHSMQSVHSVQSVQSSPGPARAGARSASPRDRKPGLARQILHNLNIFSHNNKPNVICQESKQKPEPVDEQRTDAESSSSRSGRRHSVDTVSTYLSHESKESLQQPSVGELLNCSGGSDDVFEAATAHRHDGGDGPPRACPWVCGEWGAACPACRRPLPLPAVGRLRRPLDCTTCGRRRRRAASPPPGSSQPPGTMTWTRSATPLPPWPHAASITVTYSFQSGRQSVQHPSPGAPYYAVGFPRHTLLPDTPLGLQVLAALVAAWEAGVLFTVTASLTTGREHVVSWAAPPLHPAPAAPAPAAAPPPQGDRLLLQQLHALVTLL